MTDIEMSSGNVFADLGLPDAEGMMVKAQLAAKIQQIIEARGLKQVDAASIIGIPQPKLSLLLKGQFHGISETKMLECLTKLGREVKIVVGPQRSDYTEGRVEVVFA